MGPAQSTRHCRAGTGRDQGSSDPGIRDPGTEYLRSVIRGKAGGDATGISRSTGVFSAASVLRKTLTAALGYFAFLPPALEPALLPSQKLFPAGSEDTKHLPGGSAAGNVPFPRQGESWLVPPLPPEPQGKTRPSGQQEFPGRVRDTNIFIVGGFIPKNSVRKTCRTRISVMP